MTGSYNGGNKNKLVAILHMLLLIGLEGDWMKPTFALFQGIDKMSQNFAMNWRTQECWKSVKACWSYSKRRSFRIDSTPKANKFNFANNVARVPHLLNFREEDKGTSTADHMQLECSRPLWQTPSSQQLMHAMVSSSTGQICTFPASSWPTIIYFRQSDSTLGKSKASKKTDV